MINRTLMGLLVTFLWLFFYLLLQVDCQNYIRVLEQIDDNTRQLLVCGTNAYNPMCRHYMNSQVSKEFSGRGVCPYDPRHNSTAIYAGK